ncbi:hypothetical protein EJD94_27905 [Mycolicibacterium peregrinum]|nr:hypothetical protein EJD94_27905 [Mycolicibacterium peregrinum]
MSVAAGTQSRNMLGCGDGLCREMVDRRGDIAGLSRFRFVGSERLRGCHQQLHGAAGIGCGLLDDRTEILHRRQTGCLYRVDRQRCRIGVRYGAAEQQQGGGPDCGGGAEHRFQRHTR